MTLCTEARADPFFAGKGRTVTMSPVRSASGVQPYLYETARTRQLENPYRRAIGLCDAGAKTSMWILPAKDTTVAWYSVSTLRVRPPATLRREVVPSQFQGCILDGVRGECLQFSQVFSERNLVSGLLDPALLTAESAGPEHFEVAAVKISNRWGRRITQGARLPTGDSPVGSRVPTIVTSYTRNLALCTKCAPHS